MDKFSKYAIFVYIPNKLQLTTHVEGILQMFPQCKYVMTDVESVFTSHVMENLFKIHKIIHTLTPAGHSTSNGKVERLHSTVLEITKCLCDEKNETFDNVFSEAIRPYNDTIHSVTKQKPMGIFFNPDTFDLLKTAQKKMLKFHNAKRTEKTFVEGQEIFVKGNRRNKLIPPYTKIEVKENKKNTILTKKKKIVLKDLIRK